MMKNKGNAEPKLTMGKVRQKIVKNGPDGYSQAQWGLSEKSAVLSNILKEEGAQHSRKMRRYNLRFPIGKQLGVGNELSSAKVLRG